ncbi:sensor histidine kinase [Paenibacillus thalictri]|uniref:Sensor histidine kinase n=1 Tax=Paenibacillus thalictri TaxID=2527873 RepID=A0A4Q9DV30_9BACL|nr:sensor histidine kinase [Paenibacillus thalictri]
MRRWLGGLTWKLFIICFAFVLSSVTIISELSYRFVEQEIRDNDGYYINQLLSKVDQYLTLNFSSLQTILFSVESMVKSDLSELDRVRNPLRSIFEMNYENVTNIYIIRSDLSIIGASPITRTLDDPIPERQDVVDLALNNKLQSVVSKPYKSTFSGWTVTMARYVAGSNPPIVVALDIDLHRIEDSLLRITQSESMNLALIDDKGMIVAGFQESKGLLEVNAEQRTFKVGSKTAAELLGTGRGAIPIETATGRPVTVMIKPTPKFNWLIVSISDDSRILASLSKIEAYFIGLIGIGLVLSIVVAAVVTRYIRKPLMYLTKKMNTIKQGRLDVQVSLKRNDEFGDLSHTFDLMIRQIVELIRNLDEGKELQRKLEIQILQAQINPHFLYNTLGSISNVVRLGQLDKVDPVIRSLIAILEYGVSDASEKVTLHEEIDNVKDYLQIQNIRYNKEFKLSQHIHNELLEYPVFRMLLQPIVENSIFHGYQGGRIEGRLYINAFRENERFIVEVKDDGVGMTEAESQRLLLREDDERKVSRKRIGLHNIHDRIRLNYGESYGLTILSEPGKGTVVRAEFPG